MPYLLVMLEARVCLLAEVQVGLLETLSKSLPRQAEASTYRALITTESMRSPYLQQVGSSPHKRDQSLPLCTSIYTLGKARPCIHVHSLNHTSRQCMTSP